MQRFPQNVDTVSENRYNRGDYEREEVAIR